MNRFKLLSKDRRRATRKVARRFYLDRYVSFGAPLRAPNAAERREVITSALRNEPAYQSILASLLIGIGVKLAIALIEHWIQNRIMSPDAQTFQKGEPGSE